MNNTHAWERGRRSFRERRQLRRFLILCEDTKSSLLYLKKFPVARQIVQLECFGTGMNTDSIMEEAIRRKKSAITDDTPFEAIWVVFDRDSFPDENFNRCFDLVYNHREITACWSNECFELWYLLHFGLRQTPIGRDEICSELTRLLGRTYSKNDDSIYEALLDRLETAIQNATCLAHRNAELRCRRTNPSTKVHQLIIALQKMSPEMIGLADS